MKINFILRIIGSFVYLVFFILILCSCSHKSVIQTNKERTNILQCYININENISYISENLYILKSEIPYYFDSPETYETICNNNPEMYENIYNNFNYLQESIENLGKSLKNTKLIDLSSTVEIYNDLISITKAYENLSIENINTLKELTTKENKLKDEISDFIYHISIISNLLKDEIINSKGKNGNYYKNIFRQYYKIQSITEYMIRMLKHIEISAIIKNSEYLPTANRNFEESRFIINEIKANTKNSQVLKKISEIEDKLPVIDKNLKNIIPYYEKIININKKAEKAWIESMRTLKAIDNQISIAMKEVNEH